MIDEIHLPGRDVTSAVRARRWIIEALRDIPDAPIDAIVLVVTELVSNVIRHARTECVVRIDCRPGVARVEVTDGGAGQVTPRTPELTELTGRGLLIVRSLVDEWGVSSDHEPPGKTVWVSFTWPVTSVAPTGIPTFARRTSKTPTKATERGSSSGNVLLARAKPQAA